LSCGSPHRFPFRTCRFTFLIGDCRKGAAAQFIPPRFHSSPLLVLPPLPHSPFPPSILFPTRRPPFWLIRIVSPSALFFCFYLPVGFLPQRFIDPPPDDAGSLWHLLLLLATLNECDSHLPFLSQRVTPQSQMIKQRLSRRSSCVSSALPRAHFQCHVKLSSPSTPYPSGITEVLSGFSSITNVRHTEHALDSTLNETYQTPLGSVPRTYFSRTAPPASRSPLRPSRFSCGVFVLGASTLRFPVSGSGRANVVLGHADLRFVTVRCVEFFPLFPGAVRRASNRCPFSITPCFGAALASGLPLHSGVIYGQHARAPDTRPCLTRLLLHPVRRRLPSPAPR